VIVQVPAETVSAAPTAGVPVTEGRTAETSADVRGAIGPTRLAYAVAVPVESVTRTVSPTVLPVSAATSV